MCVEITKDLSNSYVLYKNCFQDIYRKYFLFQELHQNAELLCFLVKEMTMKRDSYVLTVKVSDTRIKILCDVNSNSPRNIVCDGVQSVFCTGDRQCVCRR